MEMWFKEVKKNKDVTLDGPLMQQQALKFAQYLNNKEFKASNGWLEKFKQRMNISYKKIVGEAGVIDRDTAAKWMNNILPDLIKDYEEHDIFNADETSLFYKALPDKTLHYKGLPCNEVKVHKERLSLLLCVNMDGSEKLKPLIIGKYAKPHGVKLPRRL
jgi:hypothetical protein